MEPFRKPLESSQTARNGKPTQIPPEAAGTQPAQSGSGSWTDDDYLDELRADTVGLERRLRQSAPFQVISPEGDSGDAETQWDAEETHPSEDMCPPVSSESPLPEFLAAVFETALPVTERNGL